MSQKKKSIRESFRRSVFTRDGHKCRTCGWKPVQQDEGLDAHHITDRNLLNGGGYVKENGISLCPDCHLKAEEFHSTGISHPGYSPEELYFKIGSDYQKAKKASDRL